MRDMAMATDPTVIATTFMTPTTDCSAPPHAPTSETRLATPMHEQEQTLLVRDRDATEAHAAAQAHALQRMEESLSITAHELRSPLTSGTLAVQLAVRLLYSMLAHDSADDDTLSAQLEPLHGLLMQAASSLERLNRLVGDLADVSRIHVGTLALHLAACDLAA